MTESNFLRPREAAGELAVSGRTLERYVRAGRVTPAFRTIGGHARFSIADIEALKREWTARGTLRSRASPEATTPPVAQPPEVEAGVPECALPLVNPYSREAVIARTRKRAEAERVERRRRQQERSMKFAEQCRTFLAKRFGMTRKQLYECVWSAPATKVAASFGLSDNGLRKTCRRYQIPMPPRGYWRNREAREPTKVFRRKTLRKLRCPVIR